MSPFLSNSHTHSTFCDGKNPPQEMIAAAKRNGFVSLGFSGHAHTGFASTWCMTLDRQEKYLEAIRALQPSAQGVRIWAGLEVDALTAPYLLPATHTVDYRIGSMHYFYPEGPQADGQADKLKEYWETVFHGDGLALASHYYSIFAEFLNRERPEIIGHFDLIRKHAPTLGLFDENDPAYRKIALAALERAFPCGGVIEINTGGIARGYLPTPYPTQELLNAWREMGGKVTITSDCHDCHNLTCAYDMAWDMVKKAGFKSVHRLGTEDELWDEIDV